jgi:hypothetical protein
VFRSENDNYVETILNPRMIVKNERQVIIL